jgi:predicted HAD superfamily Cof-like phosphohydrolase
MTNFEMVAEFMTAFEQEVKTSVQMPGKQIEDLRVELIREELEELKEAIANSDAVEVADALTDLLYVVYGAGHAFGMDLDRCFKEVHASNMSKLGDDGKPIHREDGKVMKGPDFFQPNLHKCLNWS